MPLNKKGKKILKSMKEQYGSDAEKVFYASKNKGVIKNVEKKMGGGLSGGKSFGPPPEIGPNSQGLKQGGMSCPYRRGGKTSIQGVSKIQVKGQKFIGVR
jgi:hypothetical protein